MGIALVDYGAGNLTSVVKGFDAAGANVRIATEAAALDGATGIVVPGVGHFGQTSGLADAWRLRLLEAVAEGVPVLGICLGMQWLFESSEEAPDLRGLGVLLGRSVRIEGSVKVPHVGWNQIEPTGRPSTLLAGLSGPIYGYFAHSYAVVPGADAVGATTHGMRFASVVERGRVFGIQCHPEKSGRAGLVMLRNFVVVCQASEPASKAVRSW